VFFRWRGWD